MASRPLVTAAPGPLDVLYQDDALVIVNKPSGLAAHRGLSSDRDYVLTRVRDALSQQVYLVHRLDRATSGAIALVRDPRLVAPLQRAFQADQVDKRYLLLARGALPDPRMLVDYAVPRSLDTPNDRVEARTELTMRGLYEGRYALVEAHPLTGRYHQIRRHMKHLQRPIIGDTTYGDNKENRLFRERHGLLRLALHAYALRLPHPVTGVPIQITAPLPPDLAGPLAAMGFAIDEKSAQLGL